MSFSKVKIYNFALSFLLLGKQVSDTETDNTNEVRVFNLFWDEALASTLQEMNLDSLTENVALELITEEPNDLWHFAYKYPSRCTFLRRISNSVLTDTRETGINKAVGILDGKKVIFTNEYAAYADIIPNNISLDLLSSPAGIAVALKLAILSAPLNVGKGAKALLAELNARYIVALNDAQNLDKQENFRYEADSTRSEFVAARMS